MKSMMDWNSRGIGGCTIVNRSVIFNPCRIDMPVTDGEMKFEKGGPL